MAACESTAGGVAPAGPAGRCVALRCLKFGITIRFLRLVDLTCHEGGEGIVVDGAGALPRRLAVDATARFPEVFKVSVREDLLRNPVDVDRIAAEVSALLLPVDGVPR